jgi:predicted RNase H-like nuclease (RuvC/YqgF family)
MWLSRRCDEARAEVRRLTGAVERQQIEIEKLRARVIRVAGSATVCERCAQIAEPSIEVQNLRARIVEQQAEIRQLRALVAAGGVERAG